MHVPEVRHLGLVFMVLIISHWLFRGADQP